MLMNEKAIPKPCIDMKQTLNPMAECPRTRMSSTKAGKAAILMKVRKATTKKSSAARA